MEIHKPIFIVGTSRSGTTLLYHLMAQHPSLGWFSKLSLKKLMTNEFQNFVNMRRRILDMREIPYPKGPFNDSFFRDSINPIEMGIIWDKAFQGNWKCEISEKNLPFLKKSILDCLNVQKKRFLSKYPPNSVRIPQIAKVFPDSLFIHIIRDPCDVVNSMIVRSKENANEYFGIPLKENISEKNDKIKAHSLQWKQVIDEIQKSSSFLQNRYLEISYKDLTSHPESILNKIIEFSKLQSFGFLYRKDGHIFNSEGKDPKSWYFKNTKSLFYSHKIHENDDLIMQYVN